MKQPPTNFRKRQRWSRRGLLAGALALQLLLPDRAFALDPAKDALQYNCQTWIRQNGLPVNGVNAITQTKDGYLWLGTQSGMVRFDGVQFVPFNLPDGPQFQSAVISSLASSRDGGLWFGIVNGSLGFHDGQGGFSVPEDAAGVNPGVSVISLCASGDGSLWVGADNGVAHYVKGNPSATIFDGQVKVARWISEDSQGRVWLVSAANGLYCWQAGTFIPFPDESLKQEQIVAAVADLQGQIWVGTSADLRCYDSSFRRQAIPPFAKEVKTLLVDRHGVVWIGTVGDGLACYKNGAFSFFRQSEGLAHNFVTSLFEDREGSLWIGTQEGLSQLTDVKFPIYSAAQGLLGGSCHGVSASANGGLWIGTSQGVSYFDGKKATNTTTNEGLSYHYIKRAFEARNGDVYLINGKMAVEVLSQGKVVATFPNNSWPTAMAEDSQGVVVSVADKLFRVSRAGMAPYVFKEGKLPALTWIRNLLTSRDGALWVASVMGILRVKDGIVRQWTTADGLSDNDAFGFCEDGDGTIWAGLKTGIARIKGDQIRNLSRRDGLLDDSIYAIVPDDQDHLWMRSSRGIFRVRRQELNDFADGKVRRVESAAYDGLDVVKTIDNAETEYLGCKTSDGRIWFPTPLGAVAIDPARIPVNQTAPPVRIESVRANSKDLAGHVRQVVPPGPGELEFHFTALSFLAPEKVRFRYRLEGYDKDWVDTSGRRQAFYTNLKPGRYTFRVIAANADGIWNQTGDSLEIKLLPHFYQTAWFYVLGGGLMCAGLAGSYAWRVRQLKHNQQLLQAEVRNRTAELAKTNASLHHEIEERKGTEVQLKHRTQSLEREIEERNRMQSEIEKIHRQLLETSRLAGMSEVATNVLHNVGNVLNSVNVSVSLVVDNVKKSKASSLAKVVALLREHAQDLGTFFTGDPRGRQLPAYLSQVSEHLLAEQKATVKELNSLRGNIEHIKEIVAMQQSYARVSGVKEIISLRELVEDSLRMNEGALGRHGVELLREFEDVPLVNIDKHKVLQVLVNLIRNAKHACQDSERADKRLTVRVANGEGRIKISVSDNGVGIPLENLTRIFNHGFTTRKDGHGFGLHSGALAAKEMGGSLTMHSDGPGLGATFTLELPTDPAMRAATPITTGPSFVAAALVLPPPKPKL